MPNEIYHRSNWGNANAEGFGDVYFDAAATNKLYNHSDYYENSWETDKTLKDLSNKASIVLTPTAYSDGSLNTVIPPYQVLPTELVTNGTFDTDSDWTKGGGATISGGRGNIIGDGSSFTFLQQSGIFTVGKFYKVTLDAVINSGLGLKVQDGSSNENFGAITTSGTYTFYGIANNSSLVIGRRIGGTPFNSYIDNVSVKEVQEADFDFSRGSSATRVNEQGLIESIASGLPRIDYTSGFGSLLLEPQRTNLFPYSENFSEWSSLSNAVVTDNFITSPDGTQNASKFTFDGTLNCRVEKEIAVTNGNEYTFSIWLKNDNLSDPTQVWLAFSTFGQGQYITVTNEWQRFTTTQTANGSNEYPRIQTNEIGSIFAWGAQFEEGSYATSYIPTSGSTVTRSADVANNSGNADLINSTEGVLYADFYAEANNTEKWITLSDGTSTNRIIVYIPAANTLRIHVQNSSGAQAGFGSSITLNQYNKVAFSYKENDFKLFLNGTKVGSDTSGGVPSGLDRLNLADRNGTTNPFIGNVKCVAVFKEALTDAELQQLTS